MIDSIPWNEGNPTDEWGSEAFMKIDVATGGWMDIYEWDSSNVVCEDQPSIFRQWMDIGMFAINVIDCKLIYLFLV